MATVMVGFSFSGLPAAIHLPLALLAGAVAGGLYAAIAGCSASSWPPWW